MADSGFFGTTSPPPGVKTDMAGTGTSGLQVGPSSGSSGDSRTSVVSVESFRNRDRAVSHEITVPIPAESFKRKGCLY